MQPAMPKNIGLISLSYIISSTYTKNNVYQARTNDSNPTGNIEQKGNIHEQVADGRNCSWHLLVLNKATYCKVTFWYLHSCLTFGIFTLLINMCLIICFCLCLLLGYLNFCKTTCYFDMYPPQSCNSAVMPLCRKTERSIRHKTRLICLHVQK